MRIIAGTAKGRALVAPKGTDTRPTLDRVRESLFSILMRRVPDASVLDLFAGSGALGLEALSRGATNAVFVDIARDAQAAVRANIERLGFGGCAALLPCDYRAALSRLSQEGHTFDLVFLDPPYQWPNVMGLLAHIRESGVLATDALVVYEHLRGAVFDYDGYSAADHRAYGDTEITFLQPIPPTGQTQNNDAPGEYPRPS